MKDLIQEIAGWSPLSVRLFNTCGLDQLALRGGYMPAPVQPTPREIKKVAEALRTVEDFAEFAELSKLLEQAQPMIRLCESPGGARVKNQPIRQN